MSFHFGCHEFFSTEVMSFSFLGVMSFLYGCHGFFFTAVMSFSFWLSRMSTVVMSLWMSTDVMDINFILGFSNC